MIPNFVLTCLNIKAYEKEQQQSMGIMPRRTIVALKLLKSVLFRGRVTKVSCLPAVLI